jgi:hypothetical protein
LSAAISMAIEANPIWPTSTTTWAMRSKSPSLPEVEQSDRTNINFALGKVYAELKDRARPFEHLLPAMHGGRRK